MMYYSSGVILGVICCAKLTLGRYEEGEIITTEKWTFVSRFCFLSDDGEFEYSIQYDRDYGPLSLLLYYDSEHQWPAVYKSNKNCREREAVLDIRLNQIIKLVPHSITSGCVEVKSNRSKILTCHHKSSFRSARERWWFLALSNCNATKGLRFRYKFLMTNGPPGDYWHEHFSADEFYILPVLMGFFFLYLLLVIAVILCASELKSRQLLHSTYKLFALSVYLQEMGVLTQGLAYLRYAVDGIGSPAVKTIGQIVEAGSEGTFLLLLLLMAKGYTITRGRLRVSSAIKITIFMCVYTVTYASLFIFEQLFFDPGEVLYTYESAAGYGLIVLRIIAWWMFIYFTVFTLKHYPEKTSFYYPFNLVGTMWFVAGPTFILAANTMVDKWVRESVVCFVHHLIALMGHVLFMLLTVPSRANKNFPYHVRTTQIGIMEITDGVAGNNTLDAFGHHPYAPGGPSSPWPRVPVGLFTIAQSNCSVSTNGNSMMIRKQSMAVRRAYTPESLILRHEEILPNANFMACMIRTEIQNSNREVSLPLRTLAERMADTTENGNSEGNPRETESDIEVSKHSQILEKSKNPFIVSNNLNEHNILESSFTTDLDSSVNEQRAFIEVENNFSSINADSKQQSSNKSSPHKIDEVSNEENQTENENIIEPGRTNDDKINSDLDETDDAVLEESFAETIDSDAPTNHGMTDLNTAASFPRDDQTRLSVRKLPPLKISDESKNKTNMAEDDAKTNSIDLETDRMNSETDDDRVRNGSERAGINSDSGQMKPNGNLKKDKRTVFHRSESRVHFQI